MLRGEVSWKLTGNKVKNPTSTANLVPLPIAGWQFPDDRCHLCRNRRPNIVTKNHTQKANNNTLQVIADASNKVSK